MAHQSDENNRLRAFEAALAALTPRGDRLARDRLMFLAGQATATAVAASDVAASDGVPLLALKQCAPPQDTACEQAVAHGRSRHVRRLAWPAACGVSTLAAAVLLVLWLHKPAPEVVERIVKQTVYVPADDAGKPSTTASTTTASSGAASDAVDGFSSRRKRFDRPTPGWWALLAGATDSTASLVSPGGNSSIAALYAQLHEGPSGLDLRDLSIGRDYRRPATAVSGATIGPSHPATQIELRDELLRVGPRQSPAAPKSTIQPKGERS